MVKDILVFEGMNGCGKSTIVNSEEFHNKLLSLPQYKDYKGISVFKCPGDGIPEVRNLIKDKNNKFDNYTYLRLSFADINELIIKKIKSKLKKKHIILLDRFVQSIVVYQYPIAGDFEEFANFFKINLRNMYNRVENLNINKRTLSFILDIPYEVSAERREKCNEKTDKFEFEFDKDHRDYDLKRTLYGLLANNRWMIDLPSILGDMSYLQYNGNTFSSYCDEIIRRIQENFKKDDL